MQHAIFLKVFLFKKLNWAMTFLKMLLYLKYYFTIDLYGWILFRGILVAGGAAVVGFLASTLWNEYKSQQEGSSSSGRGPRPSAPSFEDSPRSRKESRKQNQKTEDVPSGQKCVVCFENPREVLLEPCNHVSLCENCAEKVGSSCPICRQYITRKRAVYL